MRDDIKKIIATAIATGTLVTGASMGLDRANCDYVVQHQEEDICITTEIREIIESQLEANNGFGGLNFGG